MNNSKQIFVMQILRKTLSDRILNYKFADVNNDNRIAQFQYAIDNLSKVVHAEFSEFKRVFNDNLNRLNSLVPPKVSRLHGGYKQNIDNLVKLING